MDKKIVYTNKSGDTITLGVDAKKIDVQIDINPQDIDTHDWCLYSLGKEEAINFAQEVLRLAHEL